MLYFFLKAGEQSQIRKPTPWIEYVLSFALFSDGVLTVFVWTEPRGHLDFKKGTRAPQDNVGEGYKGSMEENKVKM